MKKLNNKGFTLIELLAVITIMGILMMVAIPSVSRTIENSRRDTFATTAGEYLNAVRNAVLADNIECNTGTASTANWVVASATPDGTYYFAIDSSTTGTTDLMESGGKSPFGNADVKGYVKWVKTTTNTTQGEFKTKVTYTIALHDSGKHGLQSGSGTTKTCEFAGQQLKRTNVNTNSDCTTDTPAAAENAKVCQLS